MKADEAYEQIRSFVSNHDYKLENVYVHNWEADSFSVTSTKYSYEIEIKVSRSDFFNDFKKDKHHLFKSYKKGWGIYKGIPLYNKHSAGTQIAKEFPDLADFKIGYHTMNAVQFTNKHVPNRFYFAVPEGLVTVDEIPEYAGLIYFGELSARVVKQAPYLHKDKINVKEMLFDKYFWLSENQKRKITRLEWRIEDLEKELKKATRPPDPGQVELPSGPLFGQV